MPTRSHGSCGSAKRHGLLWCRFAPRAGAAAQMLCWLQMCCPTHAQVALNQDVLSALREGAELPGTATWVANDSRTLVCPHEVVPPFGVACRHRPASSCSQVDLLFTSPPYVTLEVHHTNTVQCRAQHNAWPSTVPGSAQCLANHSVRRCTVPGPAQCRAQHSAWPSTVPALVQCLSRHSACLSTVPGAAQCLP